MVLANVELVNVIDTHVNMTELAFNTELLLLAFARKVGLVLYVHKQQIHAKAPVIDAIPSQCVFPLLPDMNVIVRLEKSESSVAPAFGT